MKVTATQLVKQGRLQEWAEMVTECRNSGMTVRAWCAANGVVPKTYYSRRSRLREVLFEEGKKTGALVVPEEAALTTLSDPQPVFAALPMPVAQTSAGNSDSRSAVTVHIGSYAADVHHGADAETVEMVMRMLMRL
jgi:hypothetical protein